MDKLKPTTKQQELDSLYLEANHSELVTIMETGGTKYETILYV